MQNDNKKIQQISELQQLLSFIFPEIFLEDFLQDLLLNSNSETIKRVNKFKKESFLEVKYTSHHQMSL